jgi:predicted N-acyltransferase
MRFPSKHGVIDYRGWEVVFGEAKTGFLTSNYLSYLTELRLFAAQVGWSIQKADFMTWASFDDR